MYPVVTPFKPFTRSNPQRFATLACFRKENYSKQRRFAARLVFRLTKMPFRNLQDKLAYNRRYQQENRENRAARRNTPEGKAEAEKKAKEKEAKKAATQIAANERNKERKKDKRLLDRVQKKLDKHSIDINLKNIMSSNPVTPQGTPNRRIRASETLLLTPQQRAGLRLLEDFMDAESETRKHELTPGWNHKRIAARKSPRLVSVRLKPGWNHKIIAVREPRRKSRWRFP